MIANPRLLALLKTVALAAILVVPVGAKAQYYGLYLACQGAIIADGKSKPADLTLAMRDNNETALIQSSNVLPVGETVKYKTSLQAYTVNYRMPGHRTRYWYNWYHGWIIGFYPNLKSLAWVRLSINRNSGKLSAKLQNVKGNSLGTLSMTCEGKQFDELPKPKF
ncbi:MAG: hypothetical protein WBD13_09885 [Burkholderiaceae bacterium]